MVLPASPREATVSGKPTGLGMSVTVSRKIISLRGEDTDSIHRALELFMSEYSNIRCWTEL